jgi:heme/copper-type cytochrome/quinol oxidase subunit 2
MKHSRLIRCGMVVLSAVVSLLPATASACASCFGQSDSPMAKGMNAGIFALLLVITSVLLGVAIFFAYLLRRAARLSAAATAQAADPLTLVAPDTQPISQPTH